MIQMWKYDWRQRGVLEVKQQWDYIHYPTSFRPLVGKLLTAYRDENAEIRSRATELLLFEFEVSGVSLNYPTIPGLDEGFIEQFLTKALASDQVSIRKGVVFVVRRNFNSQQWSKNLLRTAITDKDWRVRFEAAIGLAHRKDNGATMILIEAFEKVDDPEDLNDASNALGSLADPQTVRPLIDILRRSAAVKDFIPNTLHNLVKQIPEKLATEELRTLTNITPVTVMHYYPFDDNGTTQWRMIRQEVTELSELQQLAKQELTRRGL
jgi:hypothetical protein